MGSSIVATALAVCLASAAHAGDRAEREATAQRSYQEKLELMRKWGI
jgi:hypothetical protein